MGPLRRYLMAAGVGRNIWKSAAIPTNVKNRVFHLEARNYNLTSSATNARLTLPILCRKSDLLHTLDPILKSKCLHTSAPSVTAEETAFFLQEPLQQNEDPSAPLVLLFGWAGASHKNLAKYSHIYQSAGLTTLQYILPTRFIFQHTHQVPAVMSSVYTGLSSRSLSSRPVLIHCLSDTGVLCYQGLSAALAELGAELDIRGVVWDSCPGPYPEVTAARLGAVLIVNWVCGRRDGLDRGEALASCYRLLMDRAWPNYKRKLNGLPVELDMIEGKWMGHFGRDHPGPTPELFIYSDADFYLPSDYLEKEVLPLREGRDCRTVKFAKSKHVCHLKHHKAEYSKHVLEFVNEKCRFSEVVKREEELTTFRN